jgi:multiple sugar transport system ATP-binding protein
MYVTHDQTEALTMADRVAVMKDGILQQVDTPQTLYDDPDNVFVAGFIGSPAMNFTTGRLLDEDGRLAVTFAGHRLTVTDAVLERRPGARAHVGAEVVVGFRPEDLEDAAFAGAAPAGDGTTLDVTVTLAEPLGSEVVAHFDVGGANWLARLNPRTGVKAGSAVRLVVDVERLHLFDPVSGTSLRAAP